MTKLWTAQCYSINKLNGSLKIFPECYDFPRAFQVFLDFSNFSLILQVVPGCFEHCHSFFQALFEKRNSWNIAMVSLFINFIVDYFSCIIFLCANTSKGTLMEIRTVLNLIWVIPAIFNLKVFFLLFASLLA